MHRIGNLPLNLKFLNIDPLNLSVPIILSVASDIKLRIKSAHFAYNNDLISNDSIAALYQTVDFTYEELNNPNEVFVSLNGNIELGMAYLYQLINIQLMPINRLEAIIQFWEYAEKNNLQKIAYELSLKNLNTIKPSNELSVFGPKIAKAYIVSNNFENAQKWLIFSENSTNEESSIYNLNSAKLLFNLYSMKSNKNLLKILTENLEYMNKGLIDVNQENFAQKNEILNLIFSVLNSNIENPFTLKRKAIENKGMPSFKNLKSRLQGKEITPKPTNNKKLKEQDILELEEARYLLTLISKSDFMGKDIQTVYNVALKLQNIIKLYIKTEENGEI